MDTNFPEGDKYLGFENVSSNISLTLNLDIICRNRHRFATRILLSNVYIIVCHLESSFWSINQLSKLKKKRKRRRKKKRQRKSRKRKEERFLSQRNTICYMNCIYCSKQLTIRRNKKGALTTKGSFLLLKPLTHCLTTMSTMIHTNS